MPHLFSKLQFPKSQHLPVVLQTEASECGLAALAMIAAYHGHEIDLPTLRSRFAASLKGMTLQEIRNIGESLKLRSRAVRLELSDLPKLVLPCILHWDLNHFVVLKKVDSRYATIHDPARGVRKLKIQELSKHFTGVALECVRAADFEPVKDTQIISLRSVVGEVRGYLSPLVQVLILAIVLEIIGLATPFYLQTVLDHVLPGNDRNFLTLLSLGYLLISVLQAGFSWARLWTLTWLSTSLTAAWVTNVFSHLLRLPLGWFEKRHIGDVASRFESLNAIQRTLTNNFVSSLFDGVMAVATLAVLFHYSVALASISLSALVLYVTLRVVVFMPLRRAEEDHLHCEAKRETELLESIRGALTLKLYDQREARTSRYSNSVIESLNQHTKVQKITIGFSVLSRLIINLQKTAVIWLAATLVLHRDFSPGMTVACVAYAEQFMTRMTSLIDKLVDFSILNLHASRLADITMAAPEKDVESLSDIELEEASIEVRNVSFRFSESEPWILRNCSFKVNAGESVALVGASGCGKTTLAKIMLGLIVPEEGEVFCGGQDIRQAGLAKYRRIVGSVMQDDCLFSGSIVENITLFSDKFDQPLVEHCARLAAVHDDIARMPMGYQTLIGDMGSALSGGQRQRVLLARALYRTPKILVLDEATSHLDIGRESEINNAIAKLPITRIVIAHRPETIASAGRVLLMHEGRVEVESHIPVREKMIA